MVILTWVTFFCLLAILYKFAWKPILVALDAREEKIRRALEDARKAKEELEKIETTKTALIHEADLKAKEIVDRARQAAIEAAKVIDHKAKEEAHILLGNANQEIKAMTDKARMILRKESADVAVSLASKIIQDELDETKHHKLIDRFIKEFDPNVSAKS